MKLTILDVTRRARVLIATAPRVINRRQKAPAAHANTRQATGATVSRYEGGKRAIPYAVILILQ
jgi:hypothetical protein